MHALRHAFLDAPHYEALGHSNYFCQSIAAATLSWLKGVLYMHAGDCDGCDWSGRVRSRVQGHVVHSPSKAWPWTGAAMLELEQDIDVMSASTLDPPCLLQCCAYAHDSSDT